MGVTVAIVAAGMTGCGSGDGASGAVRSAFSRFYTAMSQRHAAVACRQITDAYWTGLVQGLAPPLAKRRQLSDCADGLPRLFALAGSTPLVKPGVRLTGVMVNGRTASGAIVVNGSRRPMRFVQGPERRWRIDCCAANQLNAAAPQRTFRVPSPSMSPALRTGQLITVDTRAWRARPLSVGTIIVFHPPASEDPAAVGNDCASHHEGPGHDRPCGVAASSPSADTFIKRIVGIPGDRIALRHGRLVRNGKLVRETSVIPCVPSNPDCTFQGGVVVPAGTVYVLGDNRAVSVDSREFGPIRRAWIVGVLRK